MKRRVTFEDLGLIPELVKACYDFNYKEPTEIQIKAIPYALNNRDVIGLAETGSGKTAAFVLPALQQLFQNPQSLHTLVLAPTRELVVQINEQFKILGSVIGVRVCTIIGGMDRTEQAIALAKRPHVIVASPGRIVDHLENTRGFNLKKLKFLIIDEADQLLRQDFEKEIKKIISVIPERRRTLLFSATQTYRVEKLRRATLINPIKVEVSKKFQTVSTLKQEFIFIPVIHKDVYMTFLLNEFCGKTMIIFTATIRGCQRLAYLLRNLGFHILAIYGKLNQTKRLAILNKFKEGNNNILIATDVAARGIDIPDVEMVINYDIPVNPKLYVHRVGRTARAGKTGFALNIVTQYDVELFQRIEFIIKKKMTKLNISKEEAMILLERVTEAKRIALLEIREEEGKLVKKKNKLL